MTDSSTPSSSDEGVPRPRLSLKRRNRDQPPPEPARESRAPPDRPDDSGDAPEKSADRARPNARGRSGVKLSLKKPRGETDREDAGGRTAEAGAHADSAADKDAEVRPLPADHVRSDSRAESAPAAATKNEEKPPPARPKVALRLKSEAGGQAAPTAPGPADPPASEPPERPAAPSGSQTEEPEQASDEAPSPGVEDTGPQATPGVDADHKLLLADLPFELPDRVGDDPPPLPQVEVKHGVRRAVTFDDLEPAHSTKPPPPSDAPIFKGKTRRRRSHFGRVVVGLLVAVFLFSGWLFFKMVVDDATQQPQPEVTAADETAPATAEPAVSVGAAEAFPEAPVAAATPEASPRSAVPEPTTERAEPDPVIAAIVDHLTITIARPHSESPVIIIDGVAYVPGTIIDPDSGIRFTGFVMERREAVFEDYRGARYYRYF